MQKATKDPDFLKKCQMYPISQDQWQIEIFFLEFKSTHPIGIIFDGIIFGWIFSLLKDLFHNVLSKSPFLGILVFLSISIWLAPKWSNEVVRYRVAKWLQLVRIYQILMWFHISHTTSTKMCIQICMCVLTFLPLFLSLKIMTVAT